MLRRNWLAILIMAWFPLSCGLLDYLEAPMLGTLRYQHFLIFLLLLAVYLHTIRQFLKTRKIEVNPFFLIYFGYIALTTYFFSGSFRFLLYLYALGGVFLLARIVAIEFPFLRFVRLVSASATIFVVAAWIYPIIDIEASTDLLQYGVVFESLFDHKNTFGMFLVLSMFFVLLQMLYAEARPREAMVLVLSVVALYYTQSRSAQGMALLMVFLVAAISMHRRFFTIALSGLLIVIVGLAVLGYAGDTVGFYRNRFDDDGLMLFGYALPLTGRVTIWSSIVSNMDNAQVWLFGYGYRVYFDAIAPWQLARIGLGKDFVPQDPHNGFLDIIVNFGFLGILFFAALIGRYVFLVSRVENNEPLRVGASVFVLLMLVGNLTESYFMKTTNIFIFMFWVMYLYLEASRKRSHAAAKHA